MGELLGGGWIQSLSAPTREVVRGAMAMRELDDGEQLFCQGDLPDSLYEVVSGQVIIAHHTASGIESLVTVFAAGDCVGEQSLVDGLPRANSARARGSTTVRSLNAVTFQRLRKDYPEISEALLQLISRRFRQCLTRMNEEMSCSVRQRLARRLYSLAETYNSDGANAVEFDVRLSQSDFARWVGSSRQRVNSALGELRKAGLLSLSGSAIRINDLTALRRYARTPTDA